MAFLFVDSLAQNNSRFVQMIVKTVEVVLLSVGLISSFAVMKEAVLPYSCDLVFSSFMGFWSCIRCFLSSPPTLILLLLINLTVLLILASTRRDAHALHHHQITSLLDHVNVDHHLDLDLKIAHHQYESPLDLDLQTCHPIAALPPPLPHAPPRDVAQVTPPPPRASNYNQSLIIPQPQEIDFTTPSSSEKWKDVFIQNYDDDEDEDTMEATWKAITGGGEEKPKKKQLRKSETWEAPAPRRSSAVRRLDSEEVLPTSPKWKELRKAETFNDAVSVTRRGGMIRRERDPSMSMEEFNQKVEAFIKNFNNNIKLERQESHQRFLDNSNINHPRL